MQYPTGHSLVTVQKDKRTHFSGC